MKGFECRLAPCLLAALLATAPPAESLAQEGDRAPEPPYSLRPGTRAILFEIGGDERLIAFDGATIATKWQRSEHAAWRLGLGLSLQSFTQEEELTAADSVVRDMDADLGTVDVRLTMLRMTYPRPSESVKPFLGIGPSVAFSRQRSVGEGAGARQEVRNTLWGAGVAGAVGAEWFFARSLSLLAEYGVLLEYQSTLSRRTMELGSLRTDVKFEQRSVRFAGTGVSFGLSAYF